MKPQMPESARPAVEVPGDKPVELEFKEIQRSKVPINKWEGNRTGTIESIQPWNNYTIVTIREKNDIVIFDEDANPISDFVSPLSNKNIQFSGAELKKRVPNETYLTDGKQGWGLTVPGLPVEFRAFAKMMLQNRSSIVIENMSTVNMATSNILVLSGKYILLTSKEGAFFAFVTKNANGVLLAPRDWKRLEPDDRMPDDLIVQAEKIINENEGYKQINESYYALVTDVGINIFKNEGKDKKPVFSESVPSVERNIAVDPHNPNIIYYCQSSNPRELIKLDLSAGPEAWKPVPAEIPKKYDSVRNLQMDPSGSCFLFYSKEDLVILNRDTLEEVKRVPGLSQVNFDSSGRIRAVDKDGYLVIYEIDFGKISEELDRKRIAKLADGVDLRDIFALVESQRQAEGSEGENFDYLLPIRNKYREQFNLIIPTITTEEGIYQIRQGFNKLQGLLLQQGLKVNEVQFVMDGLEEPIVAKEREFAAKTAHEVLTSVAAKLSSGLSMSSVSEARAEMDKLRAVETILDGDLRQEVRKVAAELEQASLDLFRQRGGEVIKDVQGLIERTKSDLAGFTRKTEMDDWLEFRYPQLKSRLGLLAKDVPIEAEDAYKAIIKARTELQALASDYEERFKQEYAKVREKAAERIEASAGILTQDIDGLIDRLRAKGFSDRKLAEQYLSSSEARKTLEDEISGMAGDNPDLSKGLERDLKVKISNLLTEIERGARTQVVGTGQQMVMFGETAFPKWEAKVKETVERRVDVGFEEDPKSHGPGVKAGDILGDVSLAILGSGGKVDSVRLYEGWRDENEWRFGILSRRGQEIPPSYLSAKEFRAIRGDYSDWSKGKESDLQKELAKSRDSLKEIYSRRQEIGKRDAETDKVWQVEYKTALKTYAAFCSEHNISLLRRIDQVKVAPEIEHTNGKGFVPKWQSHWVMDAQTETDLEEMAKALKMQLDLQEGLVNLKGHAGTGKDVRIKMFCALGNRPYFGIDCSKWTTEFELSEDVMLESVDGASQTIKVPSAILNGITTPGAVVYFNEFNAMPEQAQIFLHALMDEKRSLTLKTSSGKTIRALPSVLLVGSMNPGYPGTFNPQFATRSRMVSLEIGYPPLTRAPVTGDKNPNPPYDASEALRIARGIDSLADLTYEASLEHNEYVQMWDRYVNGISNGAAEPTSTQKFDMDVSLALVQFANLLRADFIKIFEKSRDARNALPVTQPITGRELRRAAYMLSRISPEEKATANPEMVARDLLDKYFLTNIDKKEDQDKLRTAMKTWTSRKRVRV